MDKRTRSDLRWSAMRSSIWLAAALFAGCAQTITTADRPDAQSSGGQDSGPPVSSPDAAVGFQDASNTDTGVTPTDAGFVDAGQSTTRSWGEAVLPANPGVIQAVWGRSEGEIYAGQSNGNLARFDGITWQTDMWREPGNQGIVAIGGSATSIYIATTNKLHVLGPNPNTLLVPSIMIINQMIVVSDTEVLLAVSERPGASLRVFDGTQITERWRSSDSAALTALYRMASGTLYLGGQQSKIWRLESGVATPETIEFPQDWSPSDRAGFIFHDFAELDGRLFAAGSRHTVFERGVDGTWRAVYQPNGDEPIVRLLALGSELYAVGRSITTGPMVRFSEGIWQTGPVHPRYHIFDLWHAPDGVLYGAGMIKNTVQGVVLVGR